VYQKVVDAKPYHSGKERMKYTIGASSYDIDHDK